MYKPNYKITEWKINHSLAMVFIFTFVGSLMSQSQNVKELELQKKKTIQSLEMTTKMLNETKRSQKSSLNKLIIISKNISSRKELIKNINSEISVIDVQIDKLTNEKTGLENELGKLKTSYAKLVQEAHFNQNTYSQILFLLSAQSFDQSIRRLRYLREFSDYRKAQVSKIELIKKQLEQKNDSLLNHKHRKVKVAQQQQTEANKLSIDEKHEKLYYSDLKTKEKKLLVEQKTQQKKINNLNKLIDNLIAQEIKKAEARRAKQQREAEQKQKEALARKKHEEPSKRTEEHSKSKTSSVAPIQNLTKEEKLYDGGFSANQGRLPWPTSNGFISGHYGVQPHALLKHVTVNNKGVYIQTPGGSLARAVFEGVVTKCVYYPGANSLVIIQHGNYRTVYANLIDLMVREGQHVSAKQNIGRIYTDSQNDNKTELYFQIYKERTLVNPESWITR